MCGIYGIINFDDQPVDEGALRILDGCMLHRGPDDSGAYRQGSVAIGMRRLAIIDLAGGHQPIANETGSVHLVLNGEIYNYRELRVALEGRGHRFSSNSDVEVLVHLYEEHGTACIHQLNGMFAFALYDQSRQLVWLARDRLGIKPLFYFKSGRRLIFSSELNGLARTSEAPISQPALAAYLGFSYFPAPLTPYEGVFRLLPGEEIQVTGRAVAQRSYWSLAKVTESGLSHRQAHEKLSALLEDAVSLQMVSDVPVGVFLSGGIDSSAIAALATQRGGAQALRTFTVDFVDKAGSDLHFAAIMARTIGSDQTVVPVTAREQQATFNELIDLMDEPMSDTAIVPTYIIARRARECGVKVLLSGAGGDELFGGYPRHFPKVPFTTTWLANLPAPLRITLATILGWRNAGWGVRFRNPALDFAVQISGINFAFLREALIRGDLYRDLIGGIERAFAKADTPAAHPRMLLDLGSYLPDNVLSLTDKGTMMASVEGRVPLLDHRIVELALSLRESDNLPRGEPKELLRSSVRSLVPHEILRRSKEGFNSPILPWIEAHVAELQLELVQNGTVELRNLIRTEVAGRWLSSPLLRRQAASSLYALYVLNRWLRSHPRAGNKLPPPTKQSL